MFEGKISFVKFLLLLLAANVKSLTCSIGQQACGSIGCYDPIIQGCMNSSTIIECIHSCNGSCYSSSQYCYNDTKICNVGELVCDVNNSYSYIDWHASGLTCYNSTYYICLNHSICSLSWKCGDQCITDSDIVCANDNRTLCYGLGSWWAYGYASEFIGVCGPQKQCYDTRRSVCLNETTVCQGLSAQLCNGSCYNLDRQSCIDGTIRCIHSCNGSCYSSSQYCYNDTKICNVGELVCDVNNSYSYIDWHASGLTCYNSTYYICLNHSICSLSWKCGDQCITDSDIVCANDNRTLCYGLGSWWAYGYASEFIGVCGSQRQCYDIRRSACLGENGIVCPIESELCSNVCYNLESQTCINVNDSVYCISNRSSTDCLPTHTVHNTSTIQTVTTTTMLRTSAITDATTVSTSQTTAFIITDCSCNNPPKVFLSISAMIFILMS